MRCHLALVMSVALLGCQNTGGLKAENPEQPTPVESATSSPPVVQPTLMGRLQNPALTEVSGMAASLRDNDLLWMLNDSGNDATLYGVSRRGATRAVWPVDADNRDWEDLAAVWWNGEAYLLIADIGDNLRVRDEYVVYVVPEPLIESDSTTPASDLLQSIPLRFRYADGSHNAEALAVIGDAIYILTKEPIGPGGSAASGLYRLRMRIDGSDTLQVAERVGNLKTPRPGIEARLAAALAGVDLNHPTGFDFTHDASHAYVLTYRHVLRFDRQTDESWAMALARQGIRIHTHDLAQAEALAVADDGTVWLTSENRAAPLWVLPAAH